VNIHRGGGGMRTIRRLQECGLKKKNARVLRKIGLRRWREMIKDDRNAQSRPLAKEIGK
jgi:hypothetical protein